MGWNPMPLFPKIFTVGVSDLTKSEMTNQALIYHRPSKWPIVTALGTAVLIHLSAVAIAFHREPAMTQLVASDSTIFPVDVDDEQVMPPNPDTSVPPPAPVPTSDSIEPRETPRPINKASVIRFWIIPPFPPSAAGVSNRVHHLQFGFRLHFS
jgi:hypothetical protein